MIAVSSGYHGVGRLANDHPDWLPIAAACYRLAQEMERFCGAWVRDDLIQNGWSGMTYGGMYGGRPVLIFPGLGLLGRYGIIQSEYSTRRGNRAYWTMPDPEGVAKALRELRIKP